MAAEATSVFERDVKVKLVSYGDEFGRGPKYAEIDINVHSMVPGAPKELRKYDGTNAKLQKDMYTTPQFKENYPNEILKPVLKAIKAWLIKQEKAAKKEHLQEEESNLEAKDYPPEEPKADEDQEGEEDEEEEEVEAESSPGADDGVDDDEEADPDVVLIAIGCERGNQRSVAVVERLATDIPKKFVKADIEIAHRDINHKKSDAQRKKARSDRRKEKSNQRMLHEEE